MGSDGAEAAVPEPIVRAPHAGEQAYLGIGGLLTQRSWQRWTLSSFLARLPISMSLLGLVLAGQAATGSLATGAKLAGVSTFCAGLFGPLRGRLLDKREMRGALQRSCFLCSAAFAAMAACVVAKVHLVVLYGLCVVIAYSLSGVWGGFRALLVVATRPISLRRAHFFESLMVEVSYGIGPLLVTALAVIGGAVAVLSGMAAVAFLAGVSLIGVVRLEPRPRARTHLLRHRGDIRALAAAAFCVGLGFGTFESNVTQRMPQYGISPSLGGVFLLLLATGSMIGGIYVSLRPVKRQNTALKASIMFGVFSLAMLPSTLAPTGAAYGACLLFASLMLVPINGLGSSEVEARIGASQRAEAFSSVQATMMIGGGLGGFLNGVLAVPLGPWNIPYLTIGLFAGLAAILAVGSRRFSVGSAAAATVVVAAIPAHGQQQDMTDCL